MKKKFNLDDHLLSMNLQTFASQEGGPSDPSSSQPKKTGDDVQKIGVDDGEGSKTDPTSPTPDPGKEAKYTDEDVDRIVNERRARWQAEQEAAKNEAKKYADMSDTEKANFDRKKLEKERDDLQAELDKTNMLSTTRQLLNEAKLPVDEAIVGMITTSEAESTKANFDVVKAYAKSVQEAAKREFLLGDKQHIGGKQLDEKGSYGIELAKSEVPVAKENPYFK